MSHANEQNMPISPELSLNLALIKERFADTDDLATRMVDLNESAGLKMAIVYFKGMADSERINLLVWRTVTSRSSLASKSHAFDFVMELTKTTCDASVTEVWAEAVMSLMSGNVVIFIDQCPKAVIGAIQAYENRTIAEPTSQTVIRGPKDGFVEGMETNISLVRRRIKHPGLRLEMMTIGKLSSTSIAIMYMDGIAKQEDVSSVRDKLETIDLDSVLDSGYIEEYLQGTKSSPFPTVYNTERPDVAAANLMEGKVAVFVDGSPFVLVLPATFPQFMSSPEDYYQRFQFGSLSRMLRYLAFFISMFSSSLYIAFTTFHKEMIPTPLLISLAAQREGIPFPAFFEALVMEITFEFLLEAGVRMPRAMGQAVSIVGALVLGESAVAAGLVSSAMVIIVSLTAICNFTTPSISLSISSRLLRFMFMVLAATFGLYGIALGFIVMVAHMVSLESIGTPYMTPYAPIQWKKQRDAILRFPLRWLHDPKRSGNS